MLLMDVNFASMLLTEEEIDQLVNFYMWRTRYILSWKPVRRTEMKEDQARSCYHLHVAKLIPQFRKSFRHQLMSFRSEMINFLHVIDMLSDSFTAYEVAVNLGLVATSYAFNNENVLALFLSLCGASLQSRADEQRKEPVILLRNDIHGLQQMNLCSTVSDSYEWKIATGSESVFVVKINESLSID